MAEGLQGFLFGILECTPRRLFSTEMDSLIQDLKIFNKNEVIRGHFS